MKCKWINEICTVFSLFVIFLHDSQLFIYLWLLVFVQALYFYFNVVISNLFNFIFEADVLRDSIN